ncbi:MAG: membrane-bound lytic murein transglycosylase MltF [Pseudomonadota bacterium]
MISLVWLGVILLGGCTPSEPQQKPWQQGLTIIVAQGENSVDMEFEQSLINLFAQQIKVKITLLPLPREQITAALAQNQGHIAAAGLRGNRPGGLRFSPAYQTVSELVVCNDTPPQQMNDLLAKTITVTAGSAQEAALVEAKQKLPALNWQSRNQTVASLLAEVATGKLQCTIANEEQLALARNFYPSLDSEFEIAAPSRLAWAISPGSDDALLEEVQRFFAQIKNDGTLRRLLDRHYGHNERLEPIDSVAFLTKTRTDLPRYRRLFEEAAALTGIEWQMLAALAYQESHWNPLATSSTNVRGMMMLTEDTADRLKVENRLDARQSILAGARYLQMLKEELPRHIPEGDRLRFALAAYNQGQGHLEDARVLAARAGLNANTWEDVKKMLPLLTQAEYFEKTKHGRARGGEAVILVETVHLYYDMLKHQTPHERPYMLPNPFQLKFPSTTATGLSQRTTAAPGKKSAVNSSRPKQQKKTRQKQQRPKQK